MTNYQSHVSVEAAKNISQWLTQKKYAEYKSELESMIEGEQWNELEDAFFKVIEFGTGGRRGTTGVGSNRINRVTIGESAQALCLYAKSHDTGAAKKGVVIACDTRLTSPELSRYAAQVCAANGFTTYLFESFRSTPELSFAVRHLKCAVGIVISASHNPPADNGFKAYWNDGAQLVSPHDRGVMEIATNISEILSVGFDRAIAQKEIVIIGSDVDEAYHQAVLGEAVGTQRELSIVYSPLHGAGQTNTLPVLEKARFTDVVTVDAQMVPDGNFPTISGGKPNPEEKSANDEAVKLLLKVDADIAITNDPDADRMGIIVNDHGTPRYLTGNQLAVLATEFSLRNLQRSGQLSPRHYIGKTIVTTDMMTAIADYYNVTTYGSMLIGFKYIGELIRNKENTDEIFVIGGEESYGLLKGDYARDKDGAVGALVLAEYAAELKAEGKNLWDRLFELFNTHGLFIERLDVAAYPGAEGFADMQRIMENFRVNPPIEIHGHAVTAVLDYKTLIRHDIGANDDSSIQCNAGDVLVYELGDSRRRLTIRPSGTEPKIKIYTQWYQETNDASVDYEIVSREVESISHELQAIATRAVEGQ